jgi:hypothetical protein
MNLFTMNKHKYPWVKKRSSRIEESTRNIISKNEEKLWIMLFLYDSHTRYEKTT